MSRRYQMARLAALLESLPELRDRLLAAGDTFAHVRVQESETAAQSHAAEVFNRLYGEAVVAIDEADQHSHQSPNELIALDEMIRRVEGSIEAYRRLGESTGSNSRTGDNTGVLLLLALLGGVWLLSRNI